MASILSYTRTLIITEAKRMLREKTAGGRFADADYERWVDLGCLAVARRTRCIRGSSVISAVSGRQNYSLSAYSKALGTWAISRIDYEGAKLKGPIPWDRMEEHIPEGKVLSSGGTPKYWCPYGTEFYVWPVPISSSPIFKVWAAEMPYSMSASAVTLTMIGMEEWMGLAVEAFTAYRGHLLDGDLQRAQAAYALYERSIQVDSNTSISDVAEEDARGSTP